MTKAKIMSDFKTRILPLFRRSSASSVKSTASSSHSGDDGPKSRSRISLLSKVKSPGFVETVAEENVADASAVAASLSLPTPCLDQHSQPVERPPTPPASPGMSLGCQTPTVVLEEPTPDQAALKASEESPQQTLDDAAKLHTPTLTRKQSLVLDTQKRFLQSLLNTDTNSEKSPKSKPPQPGKQDYFGPVQRLSSNMLHRKIWVKRPGASPTLVLINEDDLVDDVKDVILRKYGNSLGRSFDSPDVSLHIHPRDHSHARHGNGDRVLGPEEPISRVLDTYYPGGQTVNEALTIDVPQRRTPRQSPRAYLPYHVEDNRPSESGPGYFPAMPAAVNASPHLASSMSVAGSTVSAGGQHHSMSVLSTGQVPPLPSPRAGHPRQQHPHRPKYGRTDTSSPTIISASGAHADNRSVHSAAPAPPPLPTPPAPASISQNAVTTPPRQTSPRPLKARKSKKGSQAQPSMPSSLLDGAVPPISVLIVEDNIINLKLLEAFMKRLKVRWHTAMNGRDAVNKWKTGGFHLVLMDIQLPVMNGLDATKEIRRLENVNGVGVLASKIGFKPPAGSDEQDQAGHAEGNDRLKNTELFKSPVIIVALTASSLQSDRHEALAAGCNDFLTKPVNFVWLERKVMEWGCMQALIDFDGWRKWKDLSQNSNTNSSSGGGGSSSTKPGAAPNTATKTASASIATSPSRHPTTTATAATNDSPAPPSAIPSTLRDLNTQSASESTIDTISSAPSSPLTDSATVTPSPDLGSAPPAAIPTTDPRARSTAPSESRADAGPTAASTVSSTAAPSAIAASSTKDSSPTTQQSPGTSSSSPRAQAGKYDQLSKSAATAEERRRKRNSASHAGALSGVVEEREDGREVDVGA